MNNKAKNKKEAKNKKASVKSTGTYKCQICNKETKNSVDAITHLLDHGSSALEAVNALIKDQKIGRVSTADRAEDDRARNSAGETSGAKKGKKMMVAQEA